MAAPARHRLAIARLLIEPLIDDRDPARIARTRAIVGALSFTAIADRYLRSWLWWRRAVALRALGVLQLRDHTAAVDRRARRSASRRSRRGVGRPDVPARPRLASCDRRATARRVAASCPATGGAGSVRTRVRELPARLVGGRHGAPRELRASARAVWHASVAAGTCAMDARRASRGPRRRLRSARLRGSRRRGSEPGD